RANPAHAHRSYEKESPRSSIDHENCRAPVAREQVCESRRAQSASEQITNHAGLRPDPGTFGQKPRKGGQRLEGPEQPWLNLGWSIFNRNERGIRLGAWRVV